MAKKTRRRDISIFSPPIATRSVPHRTRLGPVSYKTNRFALDLIRDLRMIEDRRTHYPGLVRPVVTITVGQPARLKLKQNPRYNAPSQTKGIVAFQQPERLPVCIRRHQRREVLFAKGVGGSKKPQRKPRRNAFSDVSCK